MTPGIPTSITTYLSPHGRAFRAQGLPPRGVPFRPECRRASRPRRHHLVGHAADVHRHDSRPSRRSNGGAGRGRSHAQRRPARGPCRPDRGPGDLLLGLLPQEDSESGEGRRGAIRLSAVAGQSCTLGGSTADLTKTIFGTRDLTDQVASVRIGLASLTALPVGVLSRGPADPRLNACLGACNAGTEAMWDFCRSLPKGAKKLRAGCWSVAVAGAVACRGWCFWKFGGT